MRQSGPNSCAALVLISAAIVLTTVDRFRTPDTPGCAASLPMYRSRSGVEGVGGNIEYAFCLAARRIEGGGMGRLVFV